MLKTKVEKALNNQLLIEGESSQIYLAMASWAETQGLSGTAQFLYKHSDEERIHMLKLVQYINERGGHAVIPALSAPSRDYKTLNNMFATLLKHEIMVSSKINDLVEICLKEKDFTTNNFLQWYVSEQIEEEALARTILDKLKMIGSDKSGLYMFDRDVESITVQSNTGTKA
ncbi:MAG: ferritin [Flavobacteriales bacterium]|nr:ferritin [Flavobacteriales bacterium]